LNHIYAQIVDDSAGSTLVSASTQDKELREALDKLPKSERSKRVGEAIAERAQKQGIDAVVFDRGGYQYHGRVQAVAEGARDKGLQF
jgi:large subunit ribosomal protein L18